MKKVSQRSVARMLKAGKPLAGLLVGLSSTLGAAAERESPGLLSVLTTASEHEWPMAVSMTIKKANCDEAADMFVAAALSGASRIQMGAMMAEGRGREHLDLMLTREEWERVKASIRELPDAHVPYSFCDEFICACRTQPEDFLRKWSDPHHKPCPAGRDFGVVGPNGKFRACLHTVEEITGSVGRMTPGGLCVF